MLLASALPVSVGVVSLVVLSVSELPESDAALRSGADGVAGALLSTVMLNADDADDTLPALSVAVAVMLCEPSANAEAVMLQLPLPSAVTLPTVPATELASVTVLPASAVPVKVGVVSLVILSVSDSPVSDPAARSGADGAAGLPVSIEIARPADAAETLPAASVAVIVIVCAPSLSVEAVMLQLPLPSAVALPTVPATELPSVTVLPASAVPVNVGVLSLVTLSVLELPESDPLARSGAAGVAGTDASIATANAEDALETLPAASVAIAVMLWVVSLSKPAVNDQLPLPSAVVVPSVPLTELITVTVLLASAVPVNVGVVSLVTLSVEELPVSDAAERSGADGAAGAVVSTVINSPADAAEVLLAASVAVAVMV